MLHFIRDDDHARDVVGRLVAAMPPDEPDIDVNQYCGVARKA